MGLVSPIQDRLPHGSGSRAYMDVFTRVLNWGHQSHVRGICHNLNRIYRAGLRKKVLF